MYAVGLWGTGRKQRRRESLLGLGSREHGWCESLGTVTRSNRKYAGPWEKLRPKTTTAGYAFVECGARLVEGNDRQKYDLTAAGAGLCDVLTHGLSQIFFGEVYEDGGFLITDSLDVLRQHENLLA